MKRDGSASDNRRKLAARIAQDEAVTGEPRHAESIQPQALLAPQYDSGDHGHPNDTGYQAMADTIDLSLFRGENDWMKKWGH